MSRQLPRGFSLVELMISLAIGSIIVLALVGLLINSSRTSRNIERANLLVDTGRYASYVLQNDLWHAGFWSNHVPDFDDQTLSPTRIPAEVPDMVNFPYPPDPCTGVLGWTGEVKKALVAVPVQAYESVVICSTPSVQLPDLTNSKRPGTDILVVRHAGLCVPGQGDCPAEVAGEAFFQASRCNEDPEKYRLGNSGFTLRSKECGTSVAEKRRLVNTIYWVRNYAVTSGDGIPTLVRSTFGATGQLQPEIVAEGIEGFRIEFGIDDKSKVGQDVRPSEPIQWQDAQTRTIPRNRGDGVADRYIRCTDAAPCQVKDLMNVVVARVFLLVRSPTSTPGFSDAKTYDMGLAGTMCPTSLAGTQCNLDPAFSRHLFTSTFRLQNIAGRRDLPP